MTWNSLYGQPMINSLVQLREKIDKWQVLEVSGARLDETISKEVWMLVTKILRETSLGNVEWLASTPVRGWNFPDLDGLSLSTIVNEEWLTPQSVLAVLFAWSAKRDLRGLN
jgi:hypothetical protein